MIAVFWKILQKYFLLLLIFHIIISYMHSA